MPVEVILPKVDMDMTHGTLAVWHVAEGDIVAKGAPLFDIETHKSAMEIEAPASGSLHHIMAQPGDILPVGSVLAHIYPAGAPIPPRPPAAPPVTDAHSPAPLVPPPAAPEPLPQTAHPRATPAARARARMAGIDLHDLTGTGPNGRIQRDDVTPPRAAFMAAPAGWSVQPGPLHVSIRKGSGIPLVMLHGFGTGSQGWAALEKALDDTRPLIRIDLPGHGRSPRRRVKNFADLARMVAETFDTAIQGHDRVHLLGHSLGGALALSLADIRPRKIAALALMAPAGLGPEIDAPALYGMARASGTESLAPWLRRLSARPEQISDDYVRAAMQARRDPMLRACQSDLAHILFPDGVQAFDLRPALSRLDCPAALIWGRHDHIVPWRQALSAQNDFALYLLADTGHVPHIECPQRLARILARHLPHR